MPTQDKTCITICSSGDFYLQAIDIQSRLKKLGYKVIVPATAEIMKKSGDFDVSKHKTWFSNPDDYHKKAVFMRKHFDEIQKCDAVLILNYEKHGVKNYIGGNVLMEMGLGFYLNKPIFILNEVPAESAFLEEILGFLPIVLHGKLDKLSKEYNKIAK